MSDCLCCHSCLLRHIRHGEVHWFCPSCRQDMLSSEDAYCETGLRRSALGRRLPTVFPTVIDRLPLQDIALFQS